jgi:hypothetical protein
VAYCHNGLDSEASISQRILVVYDWASDTVPYSKTWPSEWFISYLAAGELDGVKMVGNSYGYYEYQSSDYPALLVDPDGSIQEYSCDQGDTDTNSMMCGVFADWVEGAGADTFVLPSEKQCLAWDNQGVKFGNWPTEIYPGAPGGTSLSPTALGNLDGSGNSDVLFSVLLSEGYAVLAYDSDGDILDNIGFPFTLPDNISAFGGFSIADIDRDGYIEVVFGTIDGLLHCWEFESCPTDYAPWVQFQHDRRRTGVLE